MHRTSPSSHTHTSLPAARPPLVFFFFSPPVSSQDSSAAVVVAAYKAGDHAAAVAWVDRLRSAGLAISRNGYSAAVSACCALGNPDAAAGILGAMSEARVVATASAYNAVLETICPPSEGGYSARVRLRDDDAAAPGEGEGEAAGETTAEAVESGSGRGGVVVEINGLASTGAEAEGAGGRRKEPPEEESGRGGGSRAAEKAESALSLFEVMWEREVPMNGVTYAIVICALLAAGREDEVLRLWTQVTDADGFGVVALGGLLPPPGRRFDSGRKREERDLEMEVGTRWLDLFLPWVSVRPERFWLLAQQHNCSASVSCF